MSDLDRLGKTLAATLGDGPSAARRAEQRALLLRRAAMPERSRRPQFIAAIGVASALAAGVLVWVTLRPPSLACKLADGRQPNAHEWLSAEAGEVDLRFSEGTVMTLQPGGRCRLDRVDGDEIDLALEGGSVEAAVHHHDGRRWLFHAGPYQVEVLGTRLGVSWRTVERQLKVSIHEGRVRVSGGAARDGMTVVTGEELEIDDAHSRVVLTRADAAPAEPPQLVDNGKPAVVVPPVAPPSPPADHEASDPTHGKAHRAPARPAACALADADAARLVGHLDQARDLYLQARTLSPSHACSATAAYRIGLVRQHAGDIDGAVQWFRTAVDDDPHGGGAALARGSLLTTLQAAHRDAEARTAATDYLRWHPDGDLADVARKVVGPAR